MPPVKESIVEIITLKLVLSTLKNIKNVIFILKFPFLNHY